MIYKWIAQRIGKNGLIQELEFDPDKNKPAEVELSIDPISGEWVCIKKIALEQDLLTGAYR